ncbi:hypothetical protein QJS04_geneDACA001080 [Acorus gramineus]|uniref:TLDc domain-containing protein n=1 Tax=Acorus gramineus TaxID=55184 RepID=A0AAV9AB60_ACOGR|nr:hypothetical protein QJS04_geneDACA001080 [Acorus gramineus]
MGASTSTPSRPEEKEAESLVASIGALPTLQTSFAKLSDPQSKSIPLHSLQQCLSLTPQEPLPESPSPIPDHFPSLLTHLGPSIADLFFVSGEGGGVSWVEFLRGYIACCGRMPGSADLDNLFRLYSSASARAGSPPKLEFDSDDDGKMSGSLLLGDLRMLLWVCWVMERSSRSRVEEDGLVLPDLGGLVSSAGDACGVDVLDYEIPVPAPKMRAWVLVTVPGLSQCFPRFVQDRLQRCAASEGDSEPSTSSAGDTYLSIPDTCLLSRGIAWEISLTLRSTMSEELLDFCFSRNGDKAYENLLYKSSVNGKGLSRFWSNVEGYHGPVLMLMSGSSPDALKGDTDGQRWVIGMLTEQGFENRDTFYGSSGSLYALSPIFHVLSHSGKEKNFVYCHVSPRRGYETHPKPVGLAFGGTIGNERMFIDEDFAIATIRHHAVDKTYQPGSLVPNQGFLPLEAPILEVEAWGLSGKAAREQQYSYKKREVLFTEQRRKVDLKTFANWEDSPEKMMMDMVSDPNRVQREDR